MGTEDDAWIRLGREVRRRRDALGLSQKTAAERAQTRPVARKNRGLSDQTWAAIEKGDRPKTERRKHVLVDLSWALGWTDDSAQRIIDGESPVERADPDETRTDDEPRNLASDEHILQAVQDACRAILEMIEERRR